MPDAEVFDMVSVMATSGIISSANVDKHLINQNY